MLFKKSGIRLLIIGACLSLVKSIVLAQNGIPIPRKCSTGWYITGYFTPDENDYSGALRTIAVRGKPYTFVSSFLEVIETEGWGKTKLGNYVGFYDDIWHFSPVPLDANDQELREGMVAVDPIVIALGKKVTIHSTYLQGRTFSATDVGKNGTGVYGKHIDVYMGKGKSAEQRTYEITETNKTVCVH